MRLDVGREIVRDGGRFIAAPVAGDGNVVCPRRIEALQLPRDESERRRDDDLVHDRRVLAGLDRLAESAMAPARGVRLARRTWEQEEDPRRRGRRLPVHDPTAATEGPWSMERLARVSPP